MSGVKLYYAEVLRPYRGEMSLGTAVVLASDYDRDTQALRAEIADLIEARDNRVHQRLAVIDSLETERDALRAQVEAMRAAPANERAAAFEACPESNCDWGAFYRGWMARAALQAKP